MARLVKKRRDRERGRDGFVFRCAGGTIGEGTVEYRGSDEGYRWVGVFDDGEIERGTGETYSEARRFLADFARSRRCR